VTSKCFFQLDDEGTYYLVVATGLEQAKQLMRESRRVFGRNESALDTATGLIWTELGPEQVAKKLRCNTEDERGVIKLPDANIGDWFSSEW
jgi:hypothetical protein